MSKIRFCTGLAVTLLLVGPRAFADGGHCPLGAWRIKELAMGVFCGEFERQKTTGKLVATEESAQMKNICSLTPGDGKMMAASAAGGAALFATASNWYLDQALVKKMLPNVTDQMVNDFMKGSGMTDTAVKEFAIRFGLSGDMALKNSKEVIRQALARLLLQRAGYYTPLRAAAKRATLEAATGTPEVVGALRAFLIGAGDAVFRDIMNPQQMMKEAQTDAQIAARKYLASDAFKLSSASATKAFVSSLGAIKLPFKIPARLAGASAVGGLAGAVIYEAIDLLQSESLGCDDANEMAKIVGRNPDAKCKAVRKMSPQILNGLMQPEETQELLDKHPQACSAYTQLYGRMVLQVPAGDTVMGLECGDNFQRITWGNWNNDVGNSTGGYQVVSKNGLAGMFQKSHFVWGKGNEWRDVTGLKGIGDVPLARELKAACTTGGNSVLMDIDKGLPEDPADYNLHPATGTGHTTP